MKNPLAILYIAATLALAPCVDAQNLFINGSFEFGATGWTFTGEFLVLGPPIYPALGVDGTNCARMGGANIPNSTLSQSFPVVSNTAYTMTLSTAANADDFVPRTGSVRVDVIGPDNSVLDSESFTNVSQGQAVGTNGFLTRAITFTSPAAANFATLRITDTSPNGGTAVDLLIDDVRVFAASNLAAISLPVIHDAINSSSVTPSKLRPLVADVQKATRALQRLSTKIEKRIEPEDAALAAQIQAYINVLLGIPSE
jgi:hypothetical protein